MARSGCPVSDRAPASLAAAQAVTNPSSRSRVSSALSWAVASAMSSSPAASATADRLNRFPASAGGVAGTGHVVSEADDQRAMLGVLLRGQWLLAAHQR